MEENIKKPMTLEDLSVSMEKSMENLAVMVASGFEDVMNRINKMATKEELAKSISEVKEKIESGDAAIERKVEILSRDLHNYIELSDRRYTDLKLQVGNI